MEHILFKMILIGITSAGKSTFVSRIISGKFSKDTRITIGADFFTKKLRLNNIDIEMKIWDLAGVEKTAHSLPFFCTSARGAIIMFDLTSEKEYIQIKKWLKIFRDNAVKNAPFIIVGNKLDLIDSTYGLKERKEIQLIAQELNSPYFEISVKTGYNVYAAFNKIINLVLEQILEENIQKKLPFDFTSQLMEDSKEEQYDIIAIEELIKENMIENEINEFLVLKLEEGKTQIYINGKKFRQCKRLAINIPKQSIPIYDTIDSIDEAADLYQKYLYQNKIVEGDNVRVLRDEIHDITPEQEFWGHCSNLQAWYEHNYDTRLIHSNLAFPLLKALVEAGDPDAKRVFKTEVAERFESGYPNAITSIFESRLFDYFSLEEKKQLFQHNFPVILMYIEKVSKHYTNMFPYIFEERLVDYLNPEEKTQLMQLNYPLILKWIQKMSKSRYFPKKMLDSFKDILLDHLDSEEIKLLIHSSFTAIIKDLEKIGKYYPNLFLYFFEERLLHYLSKEEKTLLIQKNHPVILSYIQKTSKHYPDKFLYIANAGILDFLLPEVKSQLIQQNHLIIFKNFHEILTDQFESYYPKLLLNIFEERLFDYLSPEEKTQLIQQNFPVLLICVKRMSRDFGSEYKISDETLYYIYLTIINAIKGTKLIDDFFKAFAEDFSFLDGVFNAIDKAIHSIKENQELKQIFIAFRNTWRNQELEKLTDMVYCNKCRIPLTPKSMDTLIMKGRVYCTYCGILNRRKYSFEAQSAYLEAKKTNKPIDVGIGPFIFKINYKRIRCPMCSALGFDFKKKSRYAKKYVCKKCGYEW